MMLRIFCQVEDFRLEDLTESEEMMSVTFGGFSSLPRDDAMSIEFAAKSHYILAEKCITNFRRIIPSEHITKLCEIYRQQNDGISGPDRQFGDD